MKSADLLYEEDILSEQEKARIIREVGEDLSLKFATHNSVSRKNVRSNGLVLPLLLGLASLIGAAIILFHISRSISLEIDNEELANRTIISESEWLILDHYIELSNRTIQSKNREIELYREQIAEYNERLETLRKLITTKREIDELVDSERVSLAARGMSSEEIKKTLDELEKEKIAALSPGLVKNYSLSLKEMNNQIDNLLVEKSESERLLEEEIAQRDELVDDYERYVKDKSESPVDPPIPALPPASAGGDLNSYDSYILGKYRTLFRMFADGEYDDLAGEIREIRGVLSNPDSPMLEDIDDSHLNNELSNLSLLALMAKEPSGISDKEETALADLVFLGRTGKVSFNLITIETEPGESVSIGDSFVVYGNMGEEIGSELARGEISLVDGEQVKGRILSLTSTQSKPAEDDPVYLLPKGE